MTRSPQSISPYQPALYRPHLSEHLPPPPIPTKLQTQMMSGFNTPSLDELRHQLTTLGPQTVHLFFHFRDGQENGMRIDNPLSSSYMDTQESREMTLESYRIVTFSGMRFLFNPTKDFLYPHFPILCKEIWENYTDIYPNSMPANADSHQLLRQYLLDIAPALDALNNVAAENLIIDFDYIFNITPFFVSDAAMIPQVAGLKSLYIDARKYFTAEYAYTSLHDILSRTSNKQEVNQETDKPADVLLPEISDDNVIEVKAWCLFKEYRRARFILETKYHDEVTKETWKVRREDEGDIISWLGCWRNAFSAGQGWTEGLYGEAERKNIFKMSLEERHGVDIAVTLQELMAYDGRSGEVDFL